MGFVTSGPMLGHSGTVNGVTYSQLPDGRTMCSTKNKKRSVPATPNQKINETDTASTADFMLPLKEFCVIGFGLEATKLGINPYNAMSKYNRKFALEGVSPNRGINYAKVLVTKGDLPAAEKMTATIVEDGVLTNWSTELIPRLTHHSDQVVIAVVIPELGLTEFIAAGPERHVGTALVNLTGVKRGCTLHIYTGFATRGGKMISNSVYQGKFKW